MEMENIIKLINTVSQSNLTSFKYEEGDSKLSLEINRAGGCMGGIIEDNVSVTTKIVMDGQKKDEKDEANLFVKSPMVGTFYSAKSEGSDPFVTVGETVKKGQIIGIVEAMKLMNEIESSYDGIVEAVLVKNQDIVEYGQNIIRIRPL